MNPYEARRSTAEKFLSFPREERQRIVVVSDSEAVVTAALAQREAGKGKAAFANVLLIGAAGPGKATRAGVAAIQALAVREMMDASPKKDLHTVASFIVSGLVGPGADIEEMTGRRLGLIIAKEVIVAGIPGVRFARRLRQRHAAFVASPVALGIAEHLPLLGGPRKNVVYVCHPRKDLYIPLAKFHHEVFLDKVREAHDVFCEIGASRIEIEAQEGYKTGLAARLHLPNVGGLGGGADAKHDALFRKASELPGSASPRLDPGSDPQRFCWYPDEPEWKRVYEDRVEHGLRAREVLLTYTDDYGVNATLEAQVEAAKFEAGGSFEKFQSTRWHWKINFPDESSQQ